ncbi:MAG: hypothetical protein ABMA25_17115 [Ilumatobacteraceae bacterium]
MKFTRRLALAVGAATLAAGLAAPTVNAAEPPPERPIARLACQGRIVDAAPVATCEWSLRPDGIASVELWRGTGAEGALEKVSVYTSTDLSVRRFADSTVEKGKRYGYVLVVTRTDGSTGHSNLNLVTFVPPRSAEALRLNCRRSAPKLIHCEWQAPTSTTAASLTLYVQVNGGTRTGLVTLSPVAAGSFDYTVVDGTKLLRFAVVSVDAAGELDGRSPVIPFAIARPRR